MVFVEAIIMISHWGFHSVEYDRNTSNTPRVVVTVCLATATLTSGLVRIMIFYQCRSFRTLLKGGSIYKGGLPC